MTFWLAGSEPDVLGSYYPNSYSNSTGFDSNYSRCSLVLNQYRPDRGFALNSGVGGDSTNGWWLHFLYMGGSLAGYTSQDFDLLYLYGEDGLLCNRIGCLDGILTLYKYHTGLGTSTNTFMGYARTYNTYTTFDIHCYKSGVDSVTDAYIDGVLTASLTHTTETNQDLHRASVYNTDDGWAAYASEFIVADVPTVGLRVKTIPMTGNSATNTAWNGDYTNIDNYQIDGEAISSGALNEVETFTHAGLGTVATSGVAAVMVNLRGSGNGANDIQTCIRSSSTNYFSSDLGVTQAVLPYSSEWTSDPATSGSFGRGGLTGLEFGVKSVT